MSSQLDERIHTMMQQVVDEAPAPPGLPDAAVVPIRTSVPGWTVAAAAAVLVLIVLGTLSLVFGGSEGSVAPAESDSIGEVDLHQMGSYFDVRSYILYAPGSEHDPVMDVYAPRNGDGPFPIVVVYHADPSAHTNESTAELSRRIAEAGAVVFNATYGGEGKYARDLALIDDQGKCALSYAAAMGPDYGGDLNDVRLVGIGLGANTAFVVQRSELAAVRRQCLADPTYARVNQVIGLDGDYTLAPDWSDPYAEHLGAVFLNEYRSATPWDMLQWRTHWPNADSLPVFDLIIDTSTSIMYDDVEAYLDLRHPRGDSLRAAWEALGVIEADQITLEDVSEMMYEQLAAFGYHVTYTVVTGTGNGLSEQSIDAIVAKIQGRWDTEASVFAVVDEFTKAWNRYDTEAIRRLVADNFEHRYGDHGFLYDLEAYLATFDETYTALNFHAELGLDRKAQPDGDDFIIEEVGTLRWEWRTPVGTFDYSEQKGVMVYRLVETENGWRIRNAHWVEDSFIFRDRNLTNRR